jgi:hypothetical protein
MSHTATVRVQRQSVLITIQNGQIKVDPEQFKISKSNQEEVLWEASDPNLVFAIDFKESPFYEKHFDNQYFASGLVRRNVPGDPKKVYKYTVTAGGLTLDPTGVITK